MVTLEQAPGEMSLAELIYYTSRDKAEFVAIPVFPSRVFRHGHLFVRKDADIITARGASGRRIGFQRWVQTAGVWMRGFLVEDYGVSPSDTEWYVATTHHWDDAHEDDIQPRDGSVIRRYASPGVTGADNAHQALLDGEVEDHRQSTVRYQPCHEGGNREGPAHDDAGNVRTGV